MEYVVIGKIVTTHALKGDVKIVVEDANHTRFAKGRTVYIGDEKRAVEVARSRDDKLTSIVHFVGYDRIDDVEDFVKSYVYADESTLPRLEEGTYYVKDLIGLEVETTSGEKIGTVKDVLQYAANDVYVVARPVGKDALIPAIKSVVEVIDIDGNRMVIAPMEGMFDED